MKLTPALERKVVVGVALFLGILVLGILVAEVTYQWPTDPDFNPRIVSGDRRTLRARVWRIAELVMIPGTIAVIAYLVNQRQRESDQKQRESTRQIAEAQVEEAAFQNYLDRMTDLLLRDDLRGSAEDAEVRSLARSRTLATVRGLHGPRKSSVIHFLYESRLIDKLNCVVLLDGADLSETSLKGAELPEVNLARTKLRGSLLVDAHLERADLTHANLQGLKRGDDTAATSLVRAHLNGAKLVCANLIDTHLMDADLTDADLRECLLTRAVLKNAILKSADLTGADVRGANLTGADLTDAKLTDAIYNEKTLWPIGFDPEKSGAKTAGAS